MHLHLHSSCRVLASSLASLTCLLFAQTACARGTSTKEPGYDTRRSALHGASPPPQWLASAGAHYSLLTDVVDAGNLTPAFGYTMRLGRKQGAWSAHLQFEQNLWIATELDQDVTNGVFNVGVGASYHYFDDRARTSVAVGPSILAFETAFDAAGSVGFFFDLRPVGLRFPFEGGYKIGFDPILLSVAIPVTDGIPLVQIQYRTAVYLELGW